MPHSFRYNNDRKEMSYLKKKKKNHKANVGEQIRFGNVIIRLSALVRYWPYKAEETKIGLRRIFGDTLYFTLETVGVPKNCVLRNGDAVLFGWNVTGSKLCLVLDGIGTVDVLEFDGVLFILYENVASCSYPKGRHTLEVRYLERTCFCLDSEFAGWNLDKNKICYKNGNSNAVLANKDGDLFVEQSDNKQLYYREVGVFTNAHRDRKVIVVDITVNFEEND